MAGLGSVLFRWSWTEASVLVSWVFGKASMEDCDIVHSHGFVPLGPCFLLQKHYDDFTFCFSIGARFFRPLILGYKNVF